MIYEIQTWTLIPGTISKVEEIFEKKLSLRLKYSQMAAFWHTDIGALNQVIHVWPYENYRHRNEVYDSIGNSHNIINELAEYIISMESEIYFPAPFSPNLCEGKKLGNIYEMRIYQHKPRSIPTVIKRWTEAMPERLKLSPIAACMWTDIGNLNRWMHIWPYSDLEERSSIRVQASKLKTWPPKSLEYMISMKNKILSPASFSPM